jgi:hypothetical protein
MARLVAVLVLLGACETARPTAPRATLDTHELPVALPTRGVAVRASGIGGDYELVSLDSDARTLRVIVHGREPADATLTLDAAQLRRLEDLATRAWSEVQHGPMLEANDIVEDLYIVDHDDAFHLRGFPIHEPGATTGRPIAAELVGALFQLAVPVIERPAKPARPATRHPNAVARTALVTPDTDPKVLPVHGVVLHTWGLAGDGMIVIDRDAGTLRSVKHLMGEKPSDRTRKLDASALDGVMAAAVDAWHETATGPTPVATDVREDLIVLDGDEAFYVSGHPLSTLGADKTGRPAAARALAAIYKIAK